MFTDKYLKGLQPKDKKYTVTESTGERGESRLQVNVYPTGAKKFQIQYFHNKARKRFEFGRYGNAPGDYTLREARIEFAELAGLVKQSIDPKAPEQPKLEGLASLGELYQNFLTWYKGKRKLNSYNTVAGFLQTGFEKQVDLHMPANAYTADMAREIIYKVWNRGAKDAALGLKSALSVMFQYGINYDNGPERFGQPKTYGIAHNPIRDIDLEHSKTPGQRYLSEQEIRAIWHATDMHPTLHRYIRLNLALAGQRISEVIAANADEFDTKASLFEIPVERVKIQARGSHVVPLSELAIQELRTCMHHRSANGLLFPSARNGKKPVPLRSLLNECNAWLAKHPNITRFTPRDIRRTCKTHMSKAGVNRDHRDMLQQHFKSDVATVHYDRYDYLQEKQQAMDIWHKYLVEIIYSY
ncbi:tyrosine-type recombinase/integrase [Bowmanella denitrificans]|uniref:tyrosine-type recombinase/integrase n=1 Tax=Bowmanella denitrificans TaxID=366582 RepID=UPI000C9C3F17|nr:site-specific integrase [Bowmanella denitrificans]